MNIETNGNKLTVNGATVELPSFAMRIFKEINGAYPDHVSTSELIDKCGISGAYTVKTGICTLRKLIKNLGCIEIITDRGIGYRVSLGGETFVNYGNLSGRFTIRTTSRQQEAYKNNQAKVFAAIRGLLDDLADEQSL